MNYAKLKNQRLDYSWDRPSLECAFSHYKPETSVQIDSCPLVIIPCVFGWRENWTRVATELSNICQLEVYVVDPRNHGESAHSDHGDYYDMSADIVAFFDRQGITKCHLMGHSMGGRTAMTIALTRPSLVKSLTCMEISPFSEPPPMPQIVRFFSDNLKDIRAQLSKGTTIENARQFCLKELEALNVEKYMREILTSNLVQNADGSFRYLVNLDFLHERFEIDHFIYPKIDKGFQGPTKFVYVENTEYTKPEDYLKLYKIFPSIDIENIEGECGHHVNLQRPNDVIQIVSTFLKSVQ